MLIYFVIVVYYMFPCTAIDIVSAGAPIGCRLRKRRCHVSTLDERAIGWFGRTLDNNVPLCACVLTDFL